MPTKDKRPAVWVGHICMNTNRLDESREFMMKLGMRPIYHGDGVSILELRGGTHLVLLKKARSPRGEAPFDLMVEDLEKTHHELAQRGLSPSRIRRGRIHSSFTVRDPSGQRVTFNSSHVSDEPV